MNQVGALALIFRNPGLTPRELAAMLTIDAAQLTAVIKQLENRKFIRREKSVSDSRSHTLHVTPAGVLEYRKLQTIVGEVDRNFVNQVLTAEERQQLLYLMDRLEKAAKDRAASFQSDPTV